MIQVTAELVGSLVAARIVGVLPAAIGSLETDSRRVGPGALFVALRGAHVDAHAFVPAAIAAGAAAVVVESELDVAVPQIVVPDTRAAISRLADTFFEHPSRALRVVGVTGTNGKTTTVHLIEAVCSAAGMPCAVIGTLGGALGAQRWPLGNTTPPALELQALLATLLTAGAKAAAMEVSSHALALGRVDDVRFAVAAFTNLTRDHLDFHGSLTEYARAKRRLLEMAPQAAVNIDDPVGAAFAREFPHALTYAIDAPARVRAEDLRLEPDGSSFRVDGTEVTLPLRGRFNVYNALAAFAAARALDVPDAAIGRALASVRPVPGRMERIAELGIEALVDYAHTPDALENVLLAARESTRGKLTVVFGCGGDRDAGKRAPMGEIAARLADGVIVTSDNPRSEDPAAIARAIALGSGSGAEIVLDRRSAIRRAIESASAGDTVVVAGKGHETYQIVGDRVLPFDDREEVRAAFAARAATRMGAAG
jgi:UDP-N-acetylmuramoyl-L-alanyl-D-glutamate--2,6-diaminopimelate ligase